MIAISSSLYIMAWLFTSYTVIHYIEEMPMHFKRLLETRKDFRISRDGYELAYLLQKYFTDLLQIDTCGANVSSACLHRSSAWHSKIWPTYVSRFAYSMTPPRTPGRVMRGRRRHSSPTSLSAARFFRSQTISPPAREAHVKQPNPFLHPAGLVLRRPRGYTT